MNKQKLIKKYNDACFAVVPVDEVLEDLQQLDEPKKVKIPQFVADVIDGAREKSPELEDALHYTWCNGTKEFTEWYRKKSNRDLFARAWLGGYEVEKEKRYLVKIKGIEPDFDILKYNLGARNWFTGSRHEYSSFRLHHTRKELEDAGFGWVFDCEGVEVEEVEA